MGDINKSLRSDLVRMLDNIHYDIEIILDDYNKEDGPLQNQLLEVAKTYINSYDSKLKLSDSSLNFVINKAMQFYDCKSDEENDLLCEVLETLYNKDFINGTFRGNSQGDWLDYICPEDLGPRLNYIEAVIMGTGTEFKISTEKCERDDFETDAVDCYYDYTDLWKEEDVKK